MAASAADVTAAGQDGAELTSVYGEMAKVFRHALVYGLATMSGKAVGFVMIPIYTRCLSPTDYGLLELVQLGMYVLAIVLALGFSGAVIRFYYEYDSEEDRNQVVSTALLSTMSLALIATLFLLTQSRLLARMFTGSEEHQLVVSLMILALFFDVALVVPLAYVRALEKSVLYAAIAVARLVLGLGLNIFFVVVLRWGVPGILLSVLIVGALSVAGLVPWVLRRVGFAIIRDKLNEMGRYGAPLVPASLGMFVLYFADRFFLSRMASLEEVGLYALGCKFAMLLPVLIVTPIGLIWDPARFAIYRRPDARAVYARAFTYFFLIAIYFSLAVALLAEDVISVMAAPEFRRAYVVVPVVIAGFLCLSTSQFFETGIHLTKRTVYRAIALLTAATINIGLNTLLIPAYGMMGAATATLLSFGTLAAVSYVLGQRQYRIPYEFDRAAKVLVAAGLVYWASTWLSMPSVFSSFAARIGMLAVFPVLLGLLGFFRAGEFRRMKLILRGGMSLIRHRFAPAEETA